MRSCKQNQNKSNSESRTESCQLPLLKAELETQDESWLVQERAAACNSPGMFNPISLQSLVVSAKFWMSSFGGCFFSFSALVHLLKDIVLTMAIADNRLMMLRRIPFAWFTHD